MTTFNVTPVRSLDETVLRQIITPGAQEPLFAVTEEGKRKLETCEMGAQRNPAPPHQAKLVWDRTHKEVVTGNSAPFFLTNTPMPIGRGVLDANSFRDQGYLDIETKIFFTDGSGGLLTPTFRFESAPWYDTEPGIAEPPELEWTTHFKLVGTAMQAGAQRGIHTMRCRWSAGGHIGNDWTYYFEGYMVWPSIPFDPEIVADDLSKRFSREIDLTKRFDPTVRRNIRLTAEVAWTINPPLFGCVRSHCYQFGDRNRSDR